MLREPIAFVTFLMLNDSFLPGALLVAHQLRCLWTRADLVCLVTEGWARAPPVRCTSPSTA